ncbi:putative Macro domain-containing protein [Helianthus annuus]|nr:putative Macro domain-containing protein [Helianthus annuus]
MKGWRGSRQGGDSASSPVDVERSLTSWSSIRLGRVQPQAPGRRTVFCNDRDANHLAKYKYRWAFCRYFPGFQRLIHILIKYNWMNKTPICYCFDVGRSYFIHTVGPKYAVKYHTTAENALSHCYRSCLELLVENELKRFFSYL